jgi:hypothetical protein
MRRFAVSYIDALLHGDDHCQLAELSSIICVAPSFSQVAPDYGLPLLAFIFVEAQCWFAQSLRSGAWTYYEATPRYRQEAMSKALRHCAPQAYADWYERGMSDWTDQAKVCAVDSWIAASDEATQRWLRRLISESRDIVMKLTE